MKEKAKVFISHSSGEHDVALQLAGRLRELGVDVWIDSEQIQLGESIPGQISKGLEETDLILVLVSRRLKQSAWCRAEYEPLLSREIEDERTIVIPILLEDVSAPPLLAAKRYFDLRAGPDQDLTELVEAIEWGAQERRVLRLLPKAVSDEGSALGLIVSSTLNEFPVKALSDERRLSGHNLVDLYRAVEQLVERFQVACDEVLPLLALDRSGLRDPAQWPRIDSVNRRLVEVAASMRRIATHIEEILARDSRLRKRLVEISRLCLGVSDIEFEWLELTLGVPTDLDEDRHPWVDETWHGRLWKPVVPDDPSRHFPDPRERHALIRTRAELDSYLEDLREATSTVLASEET
jgi:TIR domain